MKKRAGVKRKSVLDTFVKMLLRITGSGSRRALANIAMRPSTRPMFGKTGALMVSADPFEMLGRPARRTPLAFGVGRAFDSVDFDDFFDDFLHARSFADERDSMPLQVQQTAT